MCTFLYSLMPLFQLTFNSCIIQEDIEMVIKDGKHKLVGFVDLGEMHESFEKLSGNNKIK